MRVLSCYSVTRFCPPTRPISAPRPCFPRVHVTAAWRSGGSGATYRCVQSQLSSSNCAPRAVAPPTHLARLSPHPTKPGGAVNCCCCCKSTFNITVPTLVFRMRAHGFVRDSHTWCAGCKYWIETRHFGAHASHRAASVALAPVALPPAGALAPAVLAPAVPFPPPLPQPKPLSPLPDGCSPSTARVRSARLYWLQTNPSYCSRGDARSREAYAELIIKGALSTKTADTHLRSERKIAEQNARKLAHSTDSPSAKADAFAAQHGLSADATQQLSRMMERLCAAASEAARPSSMPRSKAELMRGLDAIAAAEDLTFTEVNVRFWNGATPREHM